MVNVGKEPAFLVLEMRTALSACCRSHYAKLKELVPRSCPRRYPIGVSRPTMPVSLRQRHGAFDEQGIEVHIAAGQQGIVLPNPCAPCEGRNDGPFVGEWRSPAPAGRPLPPVFANHPFPVGGALPPTQSPAAARQTIRPVAASSGPRAGCRSRRRSRPASPALCQFDHTPGKAACQWKKRSSSQDQP